MSPRPNTENEFRPYTIKFTMHMLNQGQTYDMSISVMAGLQINASTFSENMETAYSLLES